MAKIIGGPLDGTPLLSDPRTPTYTLQGHTYYRGSDGNYYYTLSGATAGDAGPLPGSAHVFGAWHKLTHAVGIGGQRALRRSAASRKRIRRVVR